jgi:hypothetical protein
MLNWRKLNGKNLAVSYSLHTAEEIKSLSDTDNSLAGKGVGC